MIHKTPCMGCEDRQVGCHITCDRFVEWSAKNEDAVKENFKKRSTDYYIIGSRVNRYTKFYRGTGKSIKIKTL